MTATTAASWKTPRILLRHLTVWAARDDTRPDPKARAAADDAISAIDAMVAELLHLRSRLCTEMLADDILAERAEAAEESRAGEAAPDAGPRPGGSGQWPVAATEDGSVLPPGWTEYTCMGCGAAYAAKPFSRTPHKCAPSAPEVAHEDPPAPLYAVPPLYDVASPEVQSFAQAVTELKSLGLHAGPLTRIVDGADGNADPAVCDHRHGRPDSVTGTWHCFDCGTDVYDDEQLAAIQAGYVSAVPVRAVDPERVVAQDELRLMQRGMVSREEFQREIAQERAAAGAWNMPADAE